MIVDGKAIAGEILAEVTVAVAALPRPPRLQVFTCAPNFETKKYLALKERKAAACGIELTLTEFPVTTSLPHIQFAISEAAETADAIVVQLPFPPHIMFDDLLVGIPPKMDADALTYDGSDGSVLPPVVGAIDAIANQHELSFTGKEVLVIGHGRLVGAPAALYLRHAGAAVTVLTKEESDLISYTKHADIIILGAGVPNLLTPAMVNDGVAVFDAGTSESNGTLVGDASPAVAAKASLFTPVPGGIGPITIAVLLQNVVRLTKRD